MMIYIQRREIKKCKRGHYRIKEFQYKDGRCRLCAAITNAAWYRENKDQHKMLMRDWYERNPGRMVELNSAWYARNRERHLETCRQWSAANLPLKAHYRRVRRAKIVAASGFATPEQVMLRVEFFDFKCSYCTGPFEEVDHAIPLDRGGTNWPANLRPACQPCNRRKGTKTIWEFLERVAA